MPVKGPCRGDTRFGRSPDVHIRVINGCISLCTSQNDLIRPLFGTVLTSFDHCLALFGRMYTVLGHLEPVLDTVLGHLEPVLDTVLGHVWDWVCTGAWDGVCTGAWDG